MPDFNKMFETVNRFTQEQLEARRKRLEDPVLEAQLENMKVELKADIHRAATTGLDALYRFALSGPLSALFGGIKTLGQVATYNLSHEKKKRSWSEIPANMVTELLAEYSKGAISATKFAGNMSLALGRTTALGARYMVGK